jgi:uncharacterized protein with PQ loop repeat
MPDLSFVLLGYLGAALGVAMVVPQIARVLRRPELAGVSPLTWGMTATCCTLWFMYGLRANQPVQLPGNAFLIAGAVAVCLYAQSHNSQTRRAAALGAAILVAVLISLWVPSAAIGYLAFALGLFSVWPQVFASVKTFRVGATSGVSTSTYGLKFVSQLCWLLFAIGTHDRAVTIAATVALAAAALVVTLEVSARSSSFRSLEARV